MLADNLMDLRYEDTIVLAVSEGAVVVAAQIAAKLHSMLTLLLMKDIVLPDQKTVIGVINEQGGFVYDNSFSPGQIEYLTNEYRELIESSKTAALRDLHGVLGSGGLIEKDFFKGRHVIVVSDGSPVGSAFEAAESYLHNIYTRSLIFATPVASVKAIDKMHVLADRVEILKPVDNYLDTDHYYDSNDLPTQAQIIDYINNNILSWQGVAVPRS